MEAAPTEMAKSEAICGNSVSAGPHQGLAGEARQRQRGDRATSFANGAGAGEGDGVDSIGGGGLSTAPPDSKHNANSA